MNPHVHFVIQHDPEELLGVMLKLLTRGNISVELRPCKLEVLGTESPTVTDEPPVSIDPDKAWSQSFHLRDGQRRYSSARIAEADQRALARQYFQVGLKRALAHAVKHGAHALAASNLLDPSHHILV